MPLTAQALTEVVESADDYAIRLIFWAEDCFRKNHTRPTKAKLIEQAGIRCRERAETSRVQEAINHAMEALLVT